MTAASAVIRAARNVGFELLLNSFARFPEEQPALVATLYDRRAETVDFYSAIIDLVLKGDPAREGGIIAAERERAGASLVDGAVAAERSADPDGKTLGIHGHAPGADRHIPRLEPGQEIALV